MIKFKDTKYNYKLHIVSIIETVQFLWLAFCLLLIFPLILLFNVFYCNLEIIIKLYLSIVKLIVKIDGLEK